MTTFTSYAKHIEQLLITIVDSNELHAKWLNTLSFLENSGARKIAACEHPTLVKEEMLKHAAEEFRHAHHLKRQIQRVSAKPMSTYSLSLILGGTATLHYLSALDLRASRYLRMQGFCKHSVKEAAYLLVTYAIELRADELYPIYDKVLRKAGSRVAVKSILLEEKEHLAEMEEGLKKLSSGFAHAAHVCALESNLCKLWLAGVAKSISAQD
ncbi:MAG: ferritin-like domain-containing protein [Parachlamydiaceae bacterium]|nr:ferritin-like domain-containing protein [Parachlamydiaceae bacterium]